MNDKNKNNIKFYNAAGDNIDVSNVRNVVHYHLPHAEDAFTHRNGRTARMDATGSVFILVGPQEELPDYIKEISTEYILPSELSLPDKPKWSTLFIAAGKKDKINNAFYV